MEEYRVRGLVYIFFLILVVGEENGFVFFEEVYFYIFYVYRDVVREVVEFRNVVVEFVSVVVIMILLVVEDFSKANGYIGNSDAGF